MNGFWLYPSAWRAGVAGLLSVCYLSVWRAGVAGLLSVWYLSAWRAGVAGLLSVCTCLCGELGWLAGLLVAGMVRLAGPLAAFFISSWVVFSCSTIFSRSSWFTCNFLI